jgi:two-component system, cell cycle sensor histidine kinase and response regulator CckA
MSLNDFHDESGSTSTNLRVLIIEDNPYDAHLIVSALTETGYLVDHERIDKRDEFSEKLRGEPYDIILADNALPGWSGLEALGIFRETGLDWPFIVVTGCLGDEAAAEYIKQGASDYVLKNRLQRLPLVIERALRQKYLEEQQRQGQKMEAVGRLAGGVAHDFNNLLTVILGRCDLLSESLPASGVSQRYVDEIRKAGEQAASLTQQLLSFSRNQLIEREVLDLNEVVSRTDTMLQRLIGEHIQLVTTLETGLAAVKVNRSQMEQLMLNLAVNARDAMSRGGKLTIETRNALLPSGAHVLLTVTDTGCGMDADTLKHVFEPFYTTKEEGKGTGIGLSTVYAIVKQSHGSIYVQSKPQAGTTFRIYLPRCDEQPQAIRARDTNGRSGGEVILLVEDDATVRKLTTEVLEYKGYKVLAADGAGEALRIIQQYAGSIDLLLTDVVMPLESGPVVAERVVEQIPDIQVLYMSGYTQPMISQHGILDKSAQLISKPFTMEALAAKVREVLSAVNAKKRA